MFIDWGWITNEYVIEGIRYLFVEYRHINEVIIAGAFGIIGVVHMLIGIVIKGCNAIYFDRKLDFLHEFIPQFLLLSCMFGYMDLLIIVKWAQDWE